MTTKRPRANQDTRQALADVISHLEALADTRPDDDPAKVATYQRVWGHAPGSNIGVSGPETVPVHGCAIDREHREAVHLYVDSWITEPLRAIAEQLAGTADWSTDNYVRQIAGR